MSPPKLIKVSLLNHQLVLENDQLLQDTYLNYLQTRDQQSVGQAKIEAFIEDNFQSLKEKHQRSGKKRAKKVKYNASKVLIIVGNTTLIREYVLNQLKDDHNLIIQRVSLLQKRNAWYFRNSILEGTQSSVQAQTNASSIMNSFFLGVKKPVAPQLS